MDDEILDFARGLLKGVKISSGKIAIPYVGDKFFDLGLRGSLYCSKSVSSIYHRDFTRNVLRACELSPLCWCTDRFGCEYVILKLPESSGRAVFMAGPFSCVQFTPSRVLELCLQAKVPPAQKEFMNQYYLSLPVVGSGIWIENLFCLLAERFWPGQGIAIRYLKDASNYGGPFQFSALSPTPDIMDYMEKKYDSELRMMSYITAGDAERVANICRRLKLSAVKRHFPDSLREHKNNLIMLNTICRLAARQGGVHPVYLDREFNQYQALVECAGGMAQLDRIYREIPLRYCSLVNMLSVRNHPAIIQKILSYIQFNLTEDLSLAALARRFAVNRNYLCTCFKNSVGRSLTAYVNMLRIDHGKFLLRNTALSVQAVAEQCGVLDPSYFYKLFVKHAGVSPSAFRESSTRAQEARTDGRGGQAKS